jgi:PAS domain S-box-containing protein
MPINPYAMDKNRERQTEPDRADILIVDDRPDKLLVYGTILEDLGQNLFTAASGEQALKQVLERDFAVILLDVNMPGMDGFETAALIRQRKKSEKTPIIFFTALSDTETHVTRGYSLGAVDYIRVPVEPDILRAKVAAFVDLYKKTEQVKRQAELMRQLQEREHRSQLAAATDRLEAETKRNRFFTLAIDMLAIAGFDGHFKQLNPSWEKTLGFTDEELRVKPLIEFVHLEDRASTEEQLHKLQAGDSIAYFENRYRTKAGGWRWLGWTAAPFAEEGLIYIFARDLTERKVAEEERLHLIREQAARAAAEAAERRAAFLAEAGISLASSLDYHTTLARLVRLAVPFMADWCVLDVRDEDGAVRRVEVAHAEPDQHDLARGLMASSPAPEDEVPQARVMRTREPFLASECNEEMLEGLAREAVARQALCAAGPCSMMVIPLVARGRPLGALTFLFGESGRRYGRLDLELAEELGRRAALAADNAWLYRSSQEARKAAERANRAKDEFLATLSHELRTPLTPILGWTVMLRSGTLDQAGILRGLEVIERNVRAQTQLIEDLLDVSRIVTGKLRVEVRPIELVPVVEAGLDAVRPSAEAKEIQFDVQLDPIDCKVLGDPDRLQQVVWNLASNAVKFTPKGGRVEVRLNRLDSQVQLSVRDNGKGISADFLPYVFDRFRQADSTSTRKYGGLGLGLAIVRHLVELHGGTVHAESPGPDQGATFTVRLPLMEERADPARSRSAADAGHAGGVRLDGVKVLVVDDELDMRDFLSVSLRQYGADVTALASVGEAVEALEREKPDVLVSDIGMPGEDGYALIRKVRALGPERGGQVPAAALTGFAQGDDTTRVLSAGYQVHLPKPVEPSQLAQVVGTLAGRSPRLN